MIFLKKILTENYSDFLRCFICTDNINIVQYNNSEVVSKNSYEFCFIKNVATFLIKQNLPVEFIVQNNLMSTKTIPVKKIQTPEIKALTQNMLTETNIIAYQKNFIYKNNLMYLTELFLNYDQKKAIEVLSDSCSEILSISCFVPFIVNHYSKIFKDDFQNFSSILFVTEFAKSWMITCVSQGKIICDRNGSLANFNKDQEIENTLNHINNRFKIDPEDILIYNLDENSLNQISRNSSINMNFISQDNKLKIKTANTKTLHYLKFAASIIFFAVFSNLALNLYKIFNISYNINIAQNEINSVDTELRHDIKIWDHINFNPVNFKKVITDKANGEQIKSVSAKFDEKTKNWETKITLDTDINDAVSYEN